MLNLRHEIQDAFYLKTLDTFYNPANDEGMAEQLIGTYIFNAAAAQHCLDAIVERGAVADTAAYTLMEELARANLQTTAQKLGNRTVECAAMAASDNIICRYGQYPAQVVTGHPNVTADTRRPVLAPPRRLDYLRLYKEPPRQGKHPEFWDVRMVDDACRPLVKVSVVSSPSFMDRLVNNLPYVRDSFWPFF